MSGRRLPAIAAAAGLLLALSAGAAERDVTGLRMAQQMQATIANALEHKDCPAAVSALNRGLRREWREAWMLAGAMHEHGVCVKADWLKAEDYYRKAHEAGERAALPRIVAGLAGPAGGRDKAAALWWALQGHLQLPEPCRQPAPLVKDPDAFVRVLRQWPARRLEACVYVAAVMSTIAGEAEFPGRAMEYGITGAVQVDFDPAQGRVDVDTRRIDTLQMTGAVDGDVLRDRESRSFARVYERQLKAVAERALAAYPRPEGIDPDWRLSTTFVYEILYR